VQVEVITLFPEMVASVLGTSILGRAQQGGQLSCRVTNLREFGLGRYRRVDDSPYGGGPGMLFRPEPVYAAVEAAIEAARVHTDAPCRLLMPSPQGRVFDQAFAQELATETRPMVILCGHYEGIDERVREGLGFEEVSVGDVVLTGGELPAMMMLDASVRFIDGVLGNAGSHGTDTFSDTVGGQLKDPQYTRPAEFRGMQVPEVLLSGHHLEIERWRAAESDKATREKRPDLLSGDNAQKGSC